MQALSKAPVIAPGARVVVRDAEWLVRKVDRTSSGGMAVTVVGMSEIVRNREAIFLSELEPSIEVLDPAETKLVADASPAYIGTRLYVESLLRQTPPTDEKLYIGHRAAMDLNSYQLDPALQALQQPRQRILIADAVGLGKTLEAGVLLAELIRRGRGKRILVVTVKSMLTQFQKELWTRFTIPLTRLDSVGIQRIRARIPTNHNPFYFYDRAIVSIDTLKNDAEYRTWLEKAWWDIIVIDEAHNVAERGGSSSLRAKLAQLLASRSDTLIMLSATPHDGRARSFASLMNMLNPTAIANPDEYTPDDIKGLYIRRFKKDIKDQVQGAFKERTIRLGTRPASPAEEAAFDCLAGLRFTRLDKAQGAEILFKTTLEKALFSSPRAALSTIDTRLRRLKSTGDATYEDDIAGLELLRECTARIGPGEFSRYQELLHLIRDIFRWKPDKRDRLVVFTERIETLNFLHEHLAKDLGLKPNQLNVLKGTAMSDIEQNKVVEDFGREEAPVRLLIASDVASEGINLHFLSHRMIHFDIPWSLMVFQQRNGRIDRYGQEETPEIVYLKTESNNEKIRGDVRILELLIQKDYEAVKNIGDPSAFMGVYDVDAEEQITARAIEQSESVEAFDKRLAKVAETDFLALLMAAQPMSTGESAGEKAETPTLFADDFEYVRAALGFLGDDPSLEHEVDVADRQVQVRLQDHLRDALPREVLADGAHIRLSPDPQLMMDEIREARKAESAWPRVHYLWPLHPVMEWLEDKINASFGRHEAPVIALQGGLQPDEAVFVVSGLIPNRKAHPLVHRWFGATFKGGRFQRIETLPELFSRTKLAAGRWPNRNQDAASIEALRKLLPEAVAKSRDWMSREREAFEHHINARLEEQLRDLERLKTRQVEQMELQFRGLSLSTRVVEERRDKRKRQIDKIFDEYLEWIQETMTTEDNAFIQVVAVMRGTS